MAPSNVDYSLYLVTDSTPAVLGHRDLAEVVEAALRGGVTICQYRDKTSDTVRKLSSRRLNPKTSEFVFVFLCFWIFWSTADWTPQAALVSTARKLHAITREHNVPLLINDRVDVALAVGCEGVHIGQDDLGTWNITGLAP